MKKYDIDVYDDFKAVDFYVNCFERSMTIVFKDFAAFNEKLIDNILENNYYDWHNDETQECCEEYIIERLPKEYKNNIVCVIYENDEEEEYE